MHKWIKHFIKATYKIAICKRCRKQQHDHGLASSLIRYSDFGLTHLRNIRSEICILTHKCTSTSMLQCITSSSSYVWIILVPAYEAHHLCLSCLGTLFSAVITLSFRSGILLIFVWCARRQQQPNSTREERREKSEVSGSSNNNKSTI